MHFAFDAAGKEVERLLGGGASFLRTYDAVGRPVVERLVAGGTQTPDTVLSRSWAWRADGLPEEVQDSLRGTRRVVSDRAGRVTAVSGHGWNEKYAYDGFGNLVSGLDEDVTATASGSSAGVGAGVGAGAGLGAGAGAAAEATVVSGTLLRQSGRSHYEYDEAGRLIRTVRRTLDGRRKTWTYTWDSQDRLVRAETPDHGTWQYGYDPLGRRTSKARLTEHGPADQVLFTWDGARLVEQQTTGADAAVTTLTWDYDPGTFRPAAQRRRTWVDGADQGAVDEAFHAVVTDLVGTPTELVTPDGRVAWHTTSNAWGRTVAVGGDDGLDCPLRFPGQYHDAETGLHYNLFRYYSPDTAAFLTPDPLGLAPSPNDHSYVSNPLTAIDPLGLYEVPEGVDEVWDRGTYPSAEHSFQKHWEKHAEPLGISKEQYLADSKAWRDQMLVAGPKPGYTASFEDYFDTGAKVFTYKSTTGGIGGFVAKAPVNKIVSFWYDPRY
jgi:RHS repeat-associated protein